MLIPALLFAAGIILLIKGGDWFVDAATGIAYRFHLPELLIGATVVSIGTTLPEVMVSATAAASGHSEIAYGNAIGSIICNAALIAAITLTVRPCAIDRKSLRLSVAAFFIAAVFYIAVAFTGFFSRLSGIILLLMFLVYMFVSVRQAIAKPAPSPSGDAEATKARSLAKDIIFLIIGAAFIAVGARLLVNNGTVIAEALGVPESVIALTFVALGTSLPELVTAISALAKGHSALSLGNIIGANLFNLVLVSGMSVTLRPFAVPSEKLIAGINSSFILDVPVMFVSMALLTLPALIRGKLSRAQGIILLCIYAAYFALQFIV